MKKHWDHHFKYYDLFQNNFSKYTKTIQFHIRRLKRYKKILDTGAGSGNLTVELLKKGHKVYAVDANELALKILERKCKQYQNKIRTKKIKVESLNIKEKFDAASSMFVIPFTEDNEAYFKNVYKHLNNKGVFTISAWAPIPNNLIELVKMIKKELKKKGILPKYQKEFSHILESSKVNEKTVAKGVHIKELKRLLRKTGFKKIKVWKRNPYGKYAYFITCRKIE